MSISLHIPQIIILALYCVNIGTHLARHGEPRKDKYNVFYELIGAALGIAILAWGGFFTE